MPPSDPSDAPPPEPADASPSSPLDDGKDATPSADVQSMAVQPLDESEAELDVAEEWETAERIEGLPPAPRTAIDVQGFSLAYGATQVLRDLTFKVARHEVTAFIGPSGCGKTTLLRSFNRMNDLIPGVAHSGDIHIGGRSIYSPELDVIDLRRRVGMVFQISNPFPKSIYENVVYGLRMAGEAKKAVLDEIVETSLTGAALWEEVRDRLHENAYVLSEGQRQRLCIARALANQPEIILMDEPCSALDPVATGRIEDLLQSLKESYTILIVTHNMQQAARVSDRTAFLNTGRLIEFSPTEQIFINPQAAETEAYLSGRFG